MPNIHTVFSFCGTKYKLIDWLKENIKFDKNEKVWVEPFCGSCGVGFNLQPKVAIFADSNPHLIDFFNFLKNEKNSVKDIEDSLIVHYMNMLAWNEKDYYNHVRDRFNCASGYNPFDFFFLAQSGFSHQLRYNRDGKLNMAYGKCDWLHNKKKVIERLEIIKKLIDNNYYEFVLQPFEKTITDFNGSKNVFLYIDPPYIGVKQDYYDDAFNLEDRNKLLELIDNSGCQFAMSEHCKSGEEENIKEQFSKYNVKFKESMFTVNKDKIKSTQEILVTNY